ncbi:molybdopterin dinucleotide binding protein [Actinokineospora auranticolor]|uniref:Molybdopterin dinucleotide binding protein n=2 Tax=Actinokineospora auranticolor TaxID=155976 RepID=A0A2S6GND1_9PSEU|nr:molybdopterin dinucleotide binding protein [Actinokineospora auranticolor]
MWVEVAVGDAREHDLAEGDLVEIRSPRGAIRAKARIGGIRQGVLFVPFHYGYWDDPDGNGHRAGNELTRTDWDPVSKQPLFKASAAALARCRAAPDRSAR